MIFTDQGLSLIEACEGCKLQSYLDQAGRYTIGYGHLDPYLGPGVVWTQERADAQLKTDVEAVAVSVTKLITIKGLDDNQFSALCCLAFNIGAHALAGSSALHAVNEGRWSFVASRIALWDKVTIDGKLIVSEGLVWRRACEVALWNLEDWKAAPDWNDLRQKPQATASANEGRATA